MSEPARIRPLALLLGVGLMLGISLQPQWLTTQEGLADHPAAMLLMWAMSAGLVRGVGFVPQHWLPRGLLGLPAMWLALLAALWRIVLIN
ncbi:cyd operon YbgE family protein [Vogesella sp. XCS3]|uniref:cyd operon YbgE family protein n=1 Tax=Vogesella sp. XCS3 TaxID=2877939 RepID=UPI001D09E77B|nr:cyd operon YbgE family protein [Vogesella sp. XCS3]UDM16602.1 cyd operon YbgE family protein [Vogesella sp. XCS3]